MLVVLAMAVGPLHPQAAGPTDGARPSSIDNGALVVIPPRDPDGWQDIRWAKVADDNGVLGGALTQRIDRIVAGGPGYVAIGSDSRGQPGAETSYAAIWLSVDGEAWVEQELNAGVGPGDAASISNIAAGPLGVVLWGGICCGEERPAAWWSQDGSAWERVPLPVGFGLATVTDVAAGPDGFVAVGISGQAMAIWTSQDGRAWSVVDSKAAGFGPGSFAAVVREDRGWLAVGQFDDRVTHDGALWRSADLAAWRKLADAAPLRGPEEVELSDVVAFAGGYLLVGSLGSHDDRVACEQLLGRGDGQLASIKDQLAVSCGWGVRTHWWSPDGDAWQLLPPVVEPPGGPPLHVRPDGRGLMEPGPVRAGGPGLVTVGYEIAGRNGPNDIRGVWVTADARTWVPVGAAPQFAPNSSVTDLAVSGRRLIAVGSTFAPDKIAVGPSNGEDAAVWIGTVLP
jgi:hypothetical protein